MMILAVDTCSARGSLALARLDGLLELVELPSEWKSTTLHGEIAGLLGRHGLRCEQLSGYAVTSGPGAFTGLRIGLTAVLGLAEAHSKPVVAISTLRVIAAAARAQLPPSFSGSLVPLLDARRGQIFGALIRPDGDGFSPVLEETVCALPALLERIRASDVATGLPDVRF